MITTHIFVSSLNVKRGKLLIPSASGEGEAALVLTS